jgi:hypothetical protein
MSWPLDIWYSWVRKRNNAETIRNYPDTPLTLIVGPENDTAVRFLVTGAEGRYHATSLAEAQDILIAHEVAGWLLVGELGLDTVNWINSCREKGLNFWPKDEPMTLFQDEWAKTITAAVRRHYYKLTSSSG